MSRLRSVVFTPIVVVVSSAAVSAGPFDPSEVPASARWYAHLDLDAARAAPVAPEVYERWLRRGDAHDALQAVRAAIGTDLLEDLTGATLYGHDAEPRSGVLLVRGKLDRERVVAILAGEATHRTATYRAHVLHTWATNEARGADAELTACFARDDLVVLSRREKEVRAALDVIDGRSAALGSAGSLPVAQVPGAVIQAAARRLEGISDEGVLLVSPWLRKTRVFSLSAGEDEGGVFARVRLRTDASRTAELIGEALRGLRALGRLRYEKEAGIARVVEAVSVTTSEDVVLVDWRMDSAELLAVIERQWERALRPK